MSLPSTIATLHRPIKGLLIHPGWLVCCLCWIFSLVLAKSDIYVQAPPRSDPVRAFSTGFQYSTPQHPREHGSRLTLVHLLIASAMASLLDALACIFFAGCCLGKSRASALLFFVWMLHGSTGSLSGRSPFCQLQLSENVANLLDI